MGLGNINSPFTSTTKVFLQDLFAIAQAYVVNGKFLLSRQKATD